MSKSRPILWAPLTLALPLLLGGCPVAIVGGLAAAGGAGYAANQERGMSGAVDDFTIKTNIQNAWIKANPNMQADLNVTVYEGRVLLTGSAPNPEIRTQAVQLARGVSGVRTIYDEIEVGPPETAMNSMKDSWITSRIKSDFVFDGKIRLGQLHDPDRQQIGLPDRVGAQPGGTRSGHDARPKHFRREAGRFLCRHPAGHAARGAAAERAERARNRPRAGGSGRCTVDPGRSAEALIRRT